MRKCPFVTLAAEFPENKGAFSTQKRNECFYLFLAPMMKYGNNFENSIFERGLGYLKLYLKLTVYEF